VLNEDLLYDIIQAHNRLFHQEVVMDEYQPLLNRVKDIRDELKRKIFFLGILTKALEKENIKPVVVGGLALEFYSTGGYATGDIDLIVPDVKILSRRLEGWGFQKEGRHWIHPELGLFIEAPGSALKGEEEKRLSIVEIEELRI